MLKAYDRIGFTSNCSIHSMTFYSFVDSIMKLYLNLDNKIYQCISFDSLSSKVFGLLRLLIFNSSNMRDVTSTCSVSDLSLALTNYSLVVKV